MRSDAALGRTVVPQVAQQCCYPDGAFHARQFSANIKRDATEKH